MTEPSAAGEQQPVASGRKAPRARYKALPCPANTRTSDQGSCRCTAP